MQETMGQIIKRLRKERMLTQEALAERLGVTFQAVSKWETDAGMPDVSQIVPLANAFGVKTDVLFGMEGQDGAEAVQEMIRSAYARIAVPATTESLLECYQTLQAGLKRWPCHPALLMQCLEVGLTLAYPENEQFDRENGERIYRECVRLADLVIRYGKSATGILRAHMSMVLLHATYGNTEAAREHAAQFPVRADMTAYAMDAHIAHGQNELRAESAAWQHAFLLHLEALLDTAAALGGLLCRAGAVRRCQIYPDYRTGPDRDGVPGRGRRFAFAGPRTRRPVRAGGGRLSAGRGDVGSAAAAERDGRPRAFGGRRPRASPDAFASGYRRRLFREAIGADKAVERAE